MKAEQEFADLDEGMQRIDALLGCAPEDWSRQSADVSSWSVARQVDHMLRSLERMLAAADMIRVGYDARIKPDGEASLPGRLILRAGAIPRGRAQAPEEVLPEELPAVEACRERYETVLQQLAAFAPHLETMRKLRGTIPHPLLGDFRAREWFRFARIHTEHHLAIVDDILGVAAD